MRVLDERTVAFPNYDGNGMYLSTGNLLASPHAGMLFIDFVSPRPSRLRLNGIAAIDGGRRADDWKRAGWASDVLPESDPVRQGGGVRYRR